MSNVATNDRRSRRRFRLIVIIFPSLALFGTLGWLDYPVDIGSIMTASVAIGIAVDDTLHFLNFFDRRLASTAVMP